MTRTRFGLAFAGFVAAIGLLALLTELKTGVGISLAQGHGLAEALYLHLRYFTILTNWGVVILMVATVVQGLRHRPLPPASRYGAVLVYILVVGTTYEILLRKTGMTHNLSFFTDMIMHDIEPTFYLAFWLGFAPKDGLGWRHAVRWLAFPALYSALTQVAGALGEGYPYFFVDAGRFGYASVATNAVVFLLAFFLLGLGAVLLSRVIPSGLESRPPSTLDDLAIKPRAG